MNNKTKKILAGLGLGLIGATTLTGCNSITLDQSQIDSLLEKGETFIDSQNDIDYKELAEELKAFMEDTSRLNFANVRAQLSRDVGNLLSLENTHNMTFVEYSSGVKKVSRIEYATDSLTKVYLYTLNENDEKTDEIYREITPTSVTTYIKDVNMMTIVSEAQAKENIQSFRAFDSLKDVVLKAEGEYVVWNVVPSISSASYNDLLITNLLYYYELMMDLTDEAFSKSLTTFEVEGNKHIYGGFGVGGYDGDLFEYQKGNMKWEISEYSYKYTMSFDNFSGTEYPFYNNEINEMYYEITYDEENESTIEFDINGYQLVSDYYASQTTTE